MLLPWQNLGTAGTTARLMNIKQRWEVQVDSTAGTIDFPLYLRRRVTWVTLQIDIEGSEGLADIGNLPDLWLQALVGGVDYTNGITWAEPFGIPRVISPYDDAEMPGSVLNNMWMVDEKDISLNVENGSCSVTLVFKNEGKWIYDDER